MERFSSGERSELSSDLQALIQQVIRNDHEQLAFPEGSRPLSKVLTALNDDAAGCEQLVQSTECEFYGDIQIAQLQSTADSNRPIDCNNNKDVNTDFESWSPQHNDNKQDCAKTTFTHSLLAPPRRERRPCSSRCRVKPPSYNLTSDQILEFH
jgi:hypothetical protein